ncbi:MAG TPA: flagellar basal body-associated FliL family protein [Candidatus Marinimicrobia bacterium]|nr:flagellar basal body-associated FliL family protein [Candidatus Neomarinimicrobiota bacterium]
MADKMNTESEEIVEKSEGGQSRLLRTLLLVFLMLILAAGAFVVTKKFILPKYQRYKIEKELLGEVSDLQKPEKKKKDDKLAVGQIHVIDNITVNTLGSNGRRFLVAEVAIETNDTVLLEEIKTRDPQFRDALINYFRNRTVLEVTAVSFYEDSKQDLTKIINGLLTGGEIDTLYYTRLILN